MDLHSIVNGITGRPQTQPDPQSGPHPSNFFPSDQYTPYQPTFSSPSGHPDSTWLRRQQRQQQQQQFSAPSRPPLTVDSRLAPNAAGPQLPPTSQFQSPLQYTSGPQYPYFQNFASSPSGFAAHPFTPRESFPPVGIPSYQGPYPQPFTTPASPVAAPQRPFARNQSSQSAPSIATINSLPSYDDGSQSSQFRPLSQSNASQSGSQAQAQQTEANTKSQLAPASHNSQNLPSINYGPVQPSNNQESVSAPAPTPHFQSDTQPFLPSSAQEARSAQYPSDKDRERSLSVSPKTRLPSQLIPESSDTVSVPNRNWADLSTPERTTFDTGLNVVNSNKHSEVNTGSVHGVNASSPEPAPALPTLPPLRLALGTQNLPSISANLSGMQFRDIAEAPPLELRQTSAQPPTTSRAEEPTSEVQGVANSLTESRPTASAEAQSSLSDRPVNKPATPHMDELPAPKNVHVSPIQRITTEIPLDVIDLVSDNSTSPRSEAAPTVQTISSDLSTARSRLPSIEVTSNVIDLVSDKATSPALEEASIARDSQLPANRRSSIASEASRSRRVEVTVQQSPIPQAEVDSTLQSDHNMPTKRSSIAPVVPETEQTNQTGQKVKTPLLGMNSVGHDHDSSWFERSSRVSIKSQSPGYSDPVPINPEVEMNADRSDHHLPAEEPTVKNQLPPKPNGVLSAHNVQPLKRSADTLDCSTQDAGPTKKRLRFAEPPRWAQRVDRRGSPFIRNKLVGRNPEGELYQNQQLDLLTNEREDSGLGEWEKSIVNIEPHEELTRLIADWIFKFIVKSPDIGVGPAGADAGSKSVFEIEARLGLLVDLDSNERLHLPVLTETVIDPDDPRLRTQFKSSMTDMDHRKINQFLNAAFLKSQPQPLAGREPPRKPLSYIHTREVDRFYQLPQSELLSHPALTRGNMNPRFAPRVRITRDQKSGKELAKIIKTNVAKLDIFSPKTKFDWRVSVNIETAYEGNVENLVEASRPGQSFERVKDRLSFRHLAYQIDLTQVITVNSRSETEHELEIEISSAMLRNQALQALKGTSTEYERLIRGLVDNIRLLNRDVSQP